MMMMLQLTLPCQHQRFLVMRSAARPIFDAPEVALQKADRGPRVENGRLRRRLRWEWGC